MFNMLIMKKELLDEYCKWLFDILFELEERTDSTRYNKFHARYIGRVSELLLDVWVNTNNVKYKEVKVLDIEPVNWLKKGMLFINSKFRGKKFIDYITKSVNGVKVEKYYDCICFNANFINTFFNLRKKSKEKMD